MQSHVRKGEDMAEAQWYVVHTYSGYENKVKANIEKTIENRSLQDQILEVSVPIQEVVELKNGVKKRVPKKLFPGYVLLNMVMNDDTWYVVRNTRGVTGFVGPGSKPVPLTEADEPCSMFIPSLLCSKKETPGTLHSTNTIAPQSKQTMRTWRFSKIAILRKPRPI